MTDLKQLNNLKSSENFEERYFFGVLILKDKTYVRTEDDELVILDCKNGANQENSPEVKNIAIEDYIAPNKEMLKNDIEVLNLIYQHYKKIGNKKQEIKYLRKIANLGDNEAKNELEKIGLEILRSEVNAKGVELLEKIENIVKNTEISLGLYSIFANNDNEKAIKYLEITIENGDINLLSKLAKIDDYTNNYFSDKIPNDIDKAIAYYKTILNNSNININNYNGILNSNDENKKFFVEVLTKLCFFCHLKKIDESYYSNYKSLFGKVFGNKNYREISENVISNLRQQINKEEQKIKIERENEMIKAKKEKIEKLNSDIMLIHKKKEELNRKRNKLELEIIKTKELKYRQEEELKRLKIEQENNIKKIDGYINDVNLRCDSQIINMIKSYTIKGNKLYGSREIIGNIKSIVERNDKNKLNDLKNKLLSGDLLFIKYTDGKYCIVNKSDFEIFQKSVTFPTNSINFEYSNSTIYRIAEDSGKTEIIIKRKTCKRQYPEGCINIENKILCKKVKTEFSKDQILKAKKGDFKLMSEFYRGIIKNIFEKNPNIEEIRICDEHDNAIKNSIVILNDEYKNLIMETNENSINEEKKKILLNEDFLKKIEMVKEEIISLDLEKLTKQYNDIINSIRELKEQEKIKNYELIETNKSAC